MKRFRFTILLAVVVLTLGWAGCNQDPDPTEGTATIEIEYVVGNDPLVFNQFNYTTLAGNSYSVTDMRYLLSDFTFHKTGGGTVQSNAVFYVDALLPATSTLDFSDVEFGTYNAISFVIGLQPTLNVPNGLPNELDFMNFAWPDTMGGGYHFMRFEGHFMDSVDQQAGILWHVGRDVSLMPFQLTHSYTLTEEQPEIGTLTMDLDQYFRDPVTIDLDTMQFSMMNLDLMAIMADNAVDVFTID